MNRNRLILFAALLALLGPLGGTAYAGEPPQGPDLCDGPECGPNPPPPPPPPPDEPNHLPYGWLGYIDGNGWAHGWACDPNDFNYAIGIHFYANDGNGNHTYIGQTQAGGWWDEGVAGACGGNPWHGFSFRLPDAYRDGVGRTLHVYAINIGPWNYNPELSGSGQLFGFGPPAGFYSEDAVPSQGYGDDYGWSSSHPAPCAVGYAAKYQAEIPHTKGPFGVWKRRLYLLVTWCVNRSGLITSARAAVRTNHGSFCANSSGPTVTHTDGGAGYSYVEYRAWTEVSCASVPFNWPRYHDSMWMRVRFYKNRLWRVVAYD